MNHELSSDIFQRETTGGRYKAQVGGLYKVQDPEDFWKSGGYKVQPKFFGKGLFIRYNGKFSENKVQPSNMGCTL